jgi:hypothetical protein
MILLPVAEKIILAGADGSHSNEDPSVILRSALARVSKDGRNAWTPGHPSRLTRARTSSDERESAHAGMTAVSVV